MKKSKAIVILIVILGALAGLAYYASIILDVYKRQDFLLQRNQIIDCLVCDQ